MVKGAISDKEAREKDLRSAKEKQEESQKEWDKMMKEPAQAGKS